MKKKVGMILSVLLLTSSVGMNAMAANLTAANNTKGYAVAAAHDMSERQKAAAEKINQLYKDANVPESISDSELYSIVNSLVYGEVYQQGQLTDKDREMITLAELTALGSSSILRTHVYTALNAGLTPTQITETVYHCTPYVGAARGLEAIEIVNDVFKEKGIALPASTATVSEENRWDKGKATQTMLFGNLGDNKPAEGETRLGRSYLPDYCFGDYYTRTGLTIEQHELLTWVCIAAIGGAEAQLKGHTTGNKNLGRTKSYMMEVATVCMPYMGYPRTLNALSAINSVYDAKA